MLGVTLPILYVKALVGFGVPTVQALTYPK